MLQWLPPLHQCKFIEVKTPKQNLAGRIRLFIEGRVVQTPKQKLAERILLGQFCFQEHCTKMAHKIGAKTAPKKALAKVQGAHQKT